MSSEGDKLPKLGIKQIKDVIDSTASLVEVLGKSTEAKDLIEFSGKLSTFAAEITPFLGAVGPLATLVLNMFAGAQDTFQEDVRKFMEDVRNSFREVNRKLDNIMDRLSHVEYAVAWFSDKTKFYEYVRNIKYARDNLVHMSRPEDPKGARKAFIEEFKLEYQSAGKHLKDMVLGSYSHSILELYKDYTKKHRGKVLQFMQQCLKHLFEAAQVEIAYAALTDSSEITQLLLVNEWKGYMEEVQAKMEAIDKEFDVKHSQQDCKDFILIDENYHKPPMDLTPKLLDFLNDKYFWKKWFVMNYKFDGPDASFDYDVEKEWNFFPNGRRILITYIDKNRSFDNKKATVELANHIKTGNDAESIRETAKGLNLGQEMVFVIENGHNAFFSATEGSLAKESFGYIVALFG